MIEYTKQAAQLGRISPFTEAARKETPSLSHFLQSLFSLLDRHHIRYCVLHSYEKLPLELPSDLDMAVHPEDVVKLTSVIADLKSRGYLPVQCLNYAVKAHTFIFVWFEGSVLNRAAVDIIDEHRRKGLILMSGEDLVAGRKWHGWFWTSDPQVEFAYLLAKKTLKRNVSHDQARRLGELVESLGRRTAERVATTLFGKASKQWVVESCISRGLESDLAVLEAQLRRTVHRADPLNLVRYWGGNVWRVFRRWSRPTGLLVAVLGPDGVGKSTLINGLREQLVGVVFRGERLFHWRPGLLPSGGEQGPTSDPHGRPVRSSAASVLRTCVQILDYWLGYWLLVRPLVARSGLVIFDRYFDDLLVDPKRYRYGGPAWVPRLLRKMIPTPDLTLVLDAPEALILARKREVEPDEVRRQRRQYRKFASDSEYCSLIDTGRPVSEVVSRATAAVTEHLSRRFESRHGSWLRLTRKESLQNALDHLAGRNSERWGGNGNRSRLSVAAASGGTSADSDESKPKEDPPQRREEERCFAVLPSLKSPQWLLPLGDPRATLQSLKIYTPYKVKARAFKSLLSASVKTGWKGWARHRITINNGEPLSLERLTTRVTGEPQPVFALSLGSPGRYSKLTAQVMRPDGQILGYIKLPLTETANDRVRHEAFILKKLWQNVELRRNVPELLYAGEWQNGYVLFQAPLTGKRGPAEYSELHQRFLRALTDPYRVDRAGEAVVREVAEQWRKAEDLMDARWRELGEQALEQAGRELTGTLIPCGVSHGDFAPWNTRVRGDELYVFDWEAASWTAPIWWDSFHFDVQVSHLLNQPRKSIFTSGGMESDRRAVLLLYLLISVSRALGERPDRDDGIRYRQRMLVRELAHNRGLQE